MVSTSVQVYLTDSFTLLGSPADRTDCDEILEVNGKTLEDLEHAQIIEYIHQVMSTLNLIFPLKMLTESLVYYSDERRERGENNCATVARLPVGSRVFGGGGGQGLVREMYCSFGMSISGCSLSRRAVEVSGQEVMLASICSVVLHPVEHPSPHCRPIRATNSMLRMHYTAALHPYLLHATVYVPSLQVP